MDSVFEDMNLSATNLDNFDLSQLAARIADTDTLVCTVHEQSEEIENLKRQMRSFNESATQINEAYAIEKHKTTQLEINESTLKCRVQQLESDVTNVQNEMVNERVLKDQIIANLEEKLADNSELVNMCQQFVVQSEILSQHKLNNKSLLSWYTKALDVLKANGLPVKRFKAKKTKAVTEPTAALIQCSEVATMTDERVATVCSSATMTEVTIEAAQIAAIQCTASTMTDEIPPQAASMVTPKTFCDKSTMHFQTTATRGTNTKWNAPQTNSVATNYPEPISIQEIFRRTICELPEMVTAIGDLKWPMTDSETQTLEATISVAAAPTKSHSDATTMTRIKNVRKQINYNRNIKRQLLLHQSFAQRLCAIKKEEESPAGSMTNLSLPLGGESVLRMPSINPQLSGLWQILGETIFSIIGSGRIFDSDVSTMDAINANLNVIRSAVESQNFAPDLAGINVNGVGCPNNASMPNSDMPAAMNTGTSEEISMALPTAQNAEIINSVQTMNTTKDVNGVPSVPEICIASKDLAIQQTPATVPELNSKNNVQSVPTAVVRTEFENECSLAAEIIFKVPKITRRVKRKIPSNTASGCATSFDSLSSTDTLPSSHPILSDESCPKKRKQNSSDNLSTESFLDVPASHLDIGNIFKYFELPTLVDPIVDVSDDGSDSDATDLLQMDEGTDDDDDDEKLIIALPTALPNYSPASPPPPPSDPNDLTDDVLVIPLDAEVSSSISAIDAAIESYSNQKAVAVSRSYQPNRIEETNPRLFASIRDHIETYLTVDWCEPQLIACCSALLTMTKRPKLLAACILEVVEDTADERLDTTCTPPAPAMTASHQRIVLLIKRITLEVMGFDTYCMLQVERTLFTLSGTEKLSFSSNINLTRLYLGLADTTAPVPHRMLLFVYKCLYYKRRSAIAMVYATLMAYPDCLPTLPSTRLVQDASTHLVHTFSQYDPLCQAIHIVLMHASFQLKASPFIVRSGSTNVLAAGDFKAEEMAFLRRTYYQHTSENRLTVELVVNNLLDRIEAGRLHNVSYAFILLAKLKGCQWARCNLIDGQLMVVLRKYVATVGACDRNDDRIATILFAMAAVVKAFPVTEEIDDYHKVFVSIMQATPAHRQRVQEAAVASLLQTSRFGVVNVYERIRDWKPSFAISRKLWLQLQTFVHRKRHTFWK